MIVNFYEASAYLGLLGFGMNFAPEERTVLFLQGAIPDGENATGEIKRWAAGCLGVRSTPAPRSKLRGEANLQLRDVPNKVDEFNDTALMIGRDVDDTACLSAFVGTVDAGTVIKNPAGIPHLCFYHPHLFIPGQRNNEDHAPCFRPLGEENRFRRDTDFDHVLEADEGVQVAKDCGMLIHAMGGQGEDWAEFHRQGKRHHEVSGKPLQVVIATAQDFAAFLKLGNGAWDKHRPTLPPGPTGKWARTVQEALNLKGSAGLKVDGDWGNRTTAAVVKFQRDHGLKADGIVGPITWGLLAS